MGVTDANPPMPEFRTDYVLQEVDADYLAKAVKPKQPKANLRRSSLGHWGSCGSSSREAHAVAVAV